MKERKKVWMLGFLFVFAVMACERENSSTAGDAESDTHDAIRWETMPRDARDAVEDTVWSESAETTDMRDVSETADTVEEALAEGEDSSGNEADEETDAVEEEEVIECSSPGAFQCINPGQLGRCSESGVLDFYAQCQPYETCIDGSCTSKPIDDASTTTVALLQSCGICGETTLTYYVDLPTFLPANCPGIRGVSNPTGKIREALAIWENGTGGRVHFAQVGNLSDAKIRIFCGRAEDEEWCSAWGALGCALSPESCADIAGTGGDRWIMVDDQDLPWEGWSNDLFVYTIAHEAGHTLGLGHSPNWFGDLMSPFASSGYPALTCTDLELFNGVWRRPWGEECDLDRCILAEACGTTTEEICNNRVDDDCDGDTDEGCPVEICNGRDDNGDGYCDEGFACCAGITGNFYTSCGSVGTKTCTSACTWGPVIPPAETCNGRDDDCDGRRDNGFICPLGDSEECINAVGVAGYRTCGMDCTWSSCCSASETCGNHFDDDCNGATDDGCSVDCSSYHCTATCSASEAESMSRRCNGSCAVEQCESVPAPCGPCWRQVDDCCRSGGSCGEYTEYYRDAWDEDNLYGCCSIGARVDRCEGDRAIQYNSCGGRIGSYTCASCIQVTPADVECSW
jgi:hypothetical protein